MTEIAVGAVPLAVCPMCAEPAVVRLPDNWQAQVASGASIAIVGCGNPWHYILEPTADGQLENAAIAHAARLYVMALDTPPPPDDDVSSYYEAGLTSDEYLNWLRTAVSAAGSPR